MTAARSSPVDPSAGRPVATLLCGPACAGKTTIARRLETDGAVRLSMDAAAWADGWRGTWPPRERMIELDLALRAELARAVASARDVVVDLSLSTREVRETWRTIARDAGADPRLVVVTAAVPTLQARMRARHDVEGPDAFRMSPEDLVAYVEGFDWPGADEPHELIDTTVPEAME